MRWNMLAAFGHFFTGVRSVSLFFNITLAAYGDLLAFLRGVTCWRHSEKFFAGVLTTNVSLFFNMMLAANGDFFDIIGEIDVHRNFPRRLHRLRRRLLRAEHAAPNVGRLQSSSPPSLLLLPL